MLKEHVTSIDHIALQLSNLPEGLHFFQDLLGFKTKFEFEYDSMQIVVLQAGKIEIEMWANGNTNPAESTSIENTKLGTHHIAVAVKDIEHVVNIVREQGYPVKQDIYEPTRGIREAIVLGPDNIAVQFIEQHIPTLIWRAIKGEFK